MAGTSCVAVPAIVGSRGSPGVSRPAAGRRHRRPRHLQRPHPRDRHPVLPAVHQQGDLSPQRTGLASRSRRAYHADSAGIRPRSRLLTEVHILQITQPAILDEQNERAGNPTPQPRPPARQQTTDGQPQSQPPTTTADLACSRNSSAPTKSHDSTRSSMSRFSALSGLGVSTSTPQACLAGPPGHAPAGAESP